MTYGIEILNSSGTSLLSMSDKTIKLASTVTVTTPTSGTTTVSVSSAATPTNSVAVLDNGAQAAVTGTGTVTLNSAYFSDSGNYNTKLRVFLL